MSLADNPRVGTRDSSRRVERSSPAIAAAIGIPAIFLAATSIVRNYRGYGSGDLAIYDQGIWNASRGHSPISTIVGGSILGDHFTPGLLAFAPLYRIWPTTVWLSVTQAVALAACIAIIARRLRPFCSTRLIALTVLSLGVAAPLAYPLLFDFHPIVIGTPFALVALWSIEDGRYRHATIMGLLAAAFRPEFAVVVVVASLVARGDRTHRARAVGVLITYSVLAQVALVWIGGESKYWEVHYAHLGSSPSDALIHPWRIATALLATSALEKAFPWLLAGGLVALGRPRKALPAFVSALPILLSHKSSFGWVGAHYGFAPTLLLATAWVDVVRQRARVLNIVIAGSLVTAILWGPVLPSISADTRIFLPTNAIGQWSASDKLRCLVRDIPNDAVVSGEARPAALLAHRERVYLWPYPFQPAPIDIRPIQAPRNSNPVLASDVSYLVVVSATKSPIPPGFVLDGVAKNWERYRRVTTTQANFADCSRE